MRSVDNFAVSMGIDWGYHGQKKIAPPGAFRESQYQWGIAHQPFLKPSTGAGFQARGEQMRRQIGTL